MKYISVEDFIDHQTTELRSLLYYLRRLLMVAHPHMRERLSFNTPFYHCFDYLCYFGKIHKKKGIEICFAKGFLLSNEQGVLQADNRKMIRGIWFHDLADFQQQEEVFLEILQEAILLNETKPTETFAKLIFAKRSKN
jgi:Domain of unknown function (DU1801)